MHFLIRDRTFVAVVESKFREPSPDDDFLFLDKSNQVMRGVIESEITLPFEPQLSENTASLYTNR